MYTCECIECGRTMVSNYECSEQECPDCGGEMKKSDTSTTEKVKEI